MTNLNFMENNDYVIKENFIPKDLYNDIKNFLHGPTINWWFRSAETATTKNSDGYYAFCWYNDWKPDHASFDTHIVPILNLLNCKAPIQVRANTSFPNGKSCDWHTDYDYTNSFTGIIYFSTHADSPTLLKINNKIIRINAIENRLVVFKSKIEHKAVYENTLNDKTFQRRIVMNLNWF